MDSRNSMFRVSFICETGNLKILPSIDKAHDGVVIGRANQPFTINVKCTDEQNPFAAKLYIDGTEVVSTKTFKRRGNFFGFRKGNGRYDQFLFENPPFLADYGNVAVELKQKAAKMGEIRIVFYNAVEVLRKPKAFQTSKQVQETTFKPVPQADSKSLQARCLSVGVGDSFQISQTGFQGNNKRQDGMVLFTHGKYDDPVDQILLRYSNPPTLMALGLLSPLNKLQFKLFPNWFLYENKLIIQAMISTIIKGFNKSKMPIVSIEQEFESITQLKLISMVKDSNYRSFFAESQYIAVSHSEFTLTKPISPEDIVKEVFSGQQNEYCVERIKQQDTPRSKFKASENLERMNDQTDLYEKIQSDFNPEKNSKRSSSEFQQSSKLRIDQKYEDQNERTDQARNDKHYLGKREHPNRQRNHNYRN